jgi:hypothetical protein
MLLFMSNYLNQGQPCLNPTCSNDTTNQYAPGYNQRNAPQYGAGQPTSPFIPPYAQQMPPTFQQNANLMPITPTTQPMPVTTESLQYYNGYLRTQIGKKVTVDFLIGTNTFVDKTGTLLGVGANYILLNEIETDDLLICDFYTIKFVKIYY